MIKQQQQIFEQNHRKSIINFIIEYEWKFNLFTRFNML